MLPLFLLLSVGLVFGAEPKLSTSDKSPREHKVITELKKQSQFHDNSTDIPRLNPQMVRASTVKQGPILGVIVYGAVKGVIYGGLLAGIITGIRKCEHSGVNPAPTMSDGAMAAGVGAAASMVGKEVGKMAGRCSHGVGPVAGAVMNSQTGREVSQAGAATVGAAIASGGMTVGTITGAIESIAFAAGAWAASLPTP